MEFLNLISDYACAYCTATYLAPPTLLAFEPELARERRSHTVMQADKKLQAESSKCNAVAQERIWKEAVHMETTAAKNWYIGLYNPNVLESF